MIGTNLKQEDFPSRKEYLVAVAVLYLREYAHLTDDIFYDDAVCGAYGLAQDLDDEFGLDINQ